MLTKKQLELLEFIYNRTQNDGVSPSFDEMKDSITSNLIDSESLALMKDDYDLAYDLIDSNSSMTSISNSLSAEITETDFVTLNNFKADIDDRRVQEYIFAPETQINEPFAIDLDESILVVSLKEIDEPYLKDLETVSLVANEMLSSNKGKEKQSMLSEEIKLSKLDNTVDDFISAYPYVTKDNFININRYSSLMPQEIISEVWGFLGILLLALMIMLLVPDLTLWLPRAFGYQG